VAHVAGLDASSIARGLGRGFRAPHRTVLFEAGDRLVLDDSYNASPDTMAAALELLATLPGRRIAVLGAMRELGDGALDAHLDVGRLAARHAHRLQVVGSEAEPIAEGARAAGMAPDAVSVDADRDAALRRLLATSRPGDVVLVKASRAAELELIVEGLLRAFAGEAVRA
jgi:UDP-N-acetylmuramoyl-tripeptide--D-alanyl-D-alanine ligase